MKRHERHDCTLKIKLLEPTGSFQGVAAVYNNVDLGGDRIEPGAFTRTIAASKVFPLLWQHQSDNPIGTVTVSDSREGLLVSGQLLMDLDEAKRAYTLIKAKVIRGLSIGYETIQESVEDGVRLLKELRLWECSIVTFPMNLDAAIGSVKALSDDEVAAHLRAIDEHRKSIDRHTRGIQAHLKSMLGFADIDDDDPEDDDDDDSDKSFVAELRKLAEQAQELATT
jgi:HK97 family phage prohead protease